MSSFLSTLSSNEVEPLLHVNMFVLLFITFRSARRCLRLIALLQEPLTGLQVIGGCTDFSGESVSRSCFIIGYSVIILTRRSLLMSGAVPTRHFPNTPFNSAFLLNGFPLSLQGGVQGSRRGRGSAVELGFDPVCFQSSSPLDFTTLLPTASWFWEKDSFPLCSG